MRDQIAQMHQVYCTLLGMQLPLHAHHERLWFEAMKEGLTEEGLRLVVSSRRQGVKMGKRHRNCLLLRNLIGGPDIVADVLNEAAMLEAEKRSYKSLSADRDSVLRATGREPGPAAVDPRSTRKILQDLLIDPGNQTNRPWPSQPTVPTDVPN